VVVDHEAGRGIGKIAGSLADPDGAHDDEAYTQEQQCKTHGHVLPNTTDRHKCERNLTFLPQLGDCKFTTAQDTVMELVLPPRICLGMPRAPARLCVGVIAYLLAMAGISALGLKLSSVVTANAIALSLPHLLDKNPRQPSRIEQRGIEVAQAIPPMPIAKMAPSTKPQVSYEVLAAQLDLAEADGLNAGVEATSARRTRLHFKRLASKFATPPAADAFNRNFGVIPIASN
jgi:hypothetical protein